ncbi:MAG: FG-GAP-like repeat-containing protein [Myxococcota bacterium]
MGRFGFACLSVVLATGCLDPDPGGAASTAGSGATSSDASSEGGSSSTASADTTGDAATDTTAASSECDPPCGRDSVCVDGTCVEQECDPAVRCCVDGRPCEDACVGSEDCEGGTCEDRGGFLTCTAPRELPFCEAGPALSRWILVPVEEPAAALAVADVLPSPGDELFVAGFESSLLLSDAGASSISGPTVDACGAEAAFAVRLGGGATGFAALRGLGGEVVLATLDVDALVLGPPQAVGVGRGASADFDDDGIDDLFGGIGGSVETQTLAYGAGTGFVVGPTLEQRAWAWVAAQYDDQVGADVVLHELDGPSLLVTEVTGRPTAVALEGGVSDNRDLATGDFDGDGDDDIVGLARSSDSVVLYPWQNVGRGSPTYLSPAVAPDAPGAPARFWNTVGDFDGDGADDVAVGTNSTLRLYFGDPTGGGLLRCHAWLATPHASTTLAAGDFDGDGFDDIAFAGGTAELSIFAHD